MTNNKEGRKLLTVLMPLYGLMVASLVCAQTLDDQQTVPLGVWGGEHIRLTVLKNGATVEYDCAFGSINEPLLHDEKGIFEARGVYSFEMGGPSRPGSPQPRQHKALYRGCVKGDRMILTTTLPETDRHIGDFSLRKDAAAELEKCM